MATNDVSAEIMALERGALERWFKGDPDRILEIYDPEIVYFDPFQPARIDGLDAMRKLYEGIRGKVHISSYAIIDPKVQQYGEVAVFTFRLITGAGKDEVRWNTTEIYRRTGSGWRIVHSNWAFTQPKHSEG